MFSQSFIRFYSFILVYDGFVFISQWKQKLNHTKTCNMSVSAFHEIIIFMAGLARPALHHMIFIYRLYILYVMNTVYTAEVDGDDSGPQESTYGKFSKYLDANLM